jgi:hypothetical protein
MALFLMRFSCGTHLVIFSRGSYWYQYSRDAINHLLYVTCALVQMSREQLPVATVGPPPGPNLTSSQIPLTQSINDVNDAVRVSCYDS